MSVLPGEPATRVGSSLSVICACLIVYCARVVRAMIVHAWSYLSVEMDVYAPHEDKDA